MLLDIEQKEKRTDCILFYDKEGDSMHLNAINM